MPNNSSDRSPFQKKKMTVKISRRSRRYVRHQNQSEKRNEAKKQLQWELNAELDKNKSKA